MNNVQIILPERSLDFISEGLRDLTKFIAENTKQEACDGFLGGEYGYGIDYKNDVFNIHPFCWCEEKNCPYCALGTPNFYYRLNEVAIWWYKYIGRSMQVSIGNMSGKLTKEIWDNIIKDCKESVLKCGVE